MQPKIQTNLNSEQLLKKVDCLIHQRTNCHLPYVAGSSEQGLYIRFFNDFAILKNGIPLLRLNAKKQRAIVAFFLLNPQIGWTKEQLITRFWDDYIINSPENNLKVTLSYIRSQFSKTSFGVSPLIHADGKYYWNRDIPIQSDVDYFKRSYFDVLSFRENDSWNYFHHLCTAIHAYSGDFLIEFQDASWLQDEKLQLERFYRSALEMLSRFCISKEAWRAAIVVNEKINQIDSINESAVRDLMRCYLRIGERGKAIRQYHILKDRLREFYGIEPDSQTRDLVSEVLGQTG